MLTHIKPSRTNMSLSMNTSISISMSVSLSISISISISISTVVVLFFTAWCLRVQSIFFIFFFFKWEFPFLFCFICAFGRPNSDEQHLLKAKFICKFYSREYDKFAAKGSALGAIKLRCLMGAVRALLVLV